MSLMEAQLMSLSVPRIRHLICYVSIVLCCADMPRLATITVSQNASHTQNSRVTCLYWLLNASLSATCIWKQAGTEVGVKLQYVVFVVKSKECR